METATTTYPVEHLLLGREAASYVLCIRQCEHCLGGTWHRAVDEGRRVRALCQVLHFNLQYTSNYN